MKIFVGDVLKEVVSKMCIMIIIMKYYLINQLYITTNRIQQQQLKDKL